MDLFNAEPMVNLLPCDGVVLYYGCVVKEQQAAGYLQRLLNEIEWRNDEAVMFGKHIVTKRKAAWYGDTNYSYTYSNISKQALPWNPTLIELKTLTERITEETYNSCLLNLYHDGKEGMGWHSDDEKSLRLHSAIASLSFGAERKFSFKHKKSGQAISVALQHGGLLLMKGNTQTNWLHSLPKASRVSKPRVNLTFRTIV